MKRSFLVVLLCCMCLLSATIGSASAQSVPEGIVLRDAETEEGLKQLSSPIFQAAGLGSDSVKFILLHDNDVNAFVAGGMKIFLHTGLLAKADNSLQLLGVIAHETGHIAGGHLLRSREAAEGATIEAAIATAVGIAAAIGSGQGDVAAGAVAGGQELARQTFLKFSRTQESSADEAGLRFLHHSQLSAIGMEQFFAKLLQDEWVPEEQQTAYGRTHPLTRDRIDRVKQAVREENKDIHALSADREEWFNRIKAKLAGYLQPENYAALHEKPSNIAEKYGVATAYYRLGKTAESLTILQSLMEIEPKNPWFYELAGQVQLENGQHLEAVRLFGEANRYFPNQPLLQVSLAQALVEKDGGSALQQAELLLQQALKKEKLPSIYRLLATIAGKQGKEGDVKLNLAEEALQMGKKSQARSLAEIAMKFFKTGSPGWLQAQDILAVAGKNADKTNK
ncbi:MAG: M48 family metalloprotease [Alphaproteobacteria bacterium]